MDRKNILETAIALTCGDRNDAYGDPTINMSAFARMLNGYLQSRRIIERPAITAEDAAIIMALAKISRLHSTALHYHPDNYIDAAAYLAMAGEAAEYIRPLKE